ncbi:MAG: M14 family metallopeptidase [Roseburia sp.]
MKNLSPNDRGVYVYYLQLALIRAGYPMALDGIFGPDTCSSLKQFTGQSSCQVMDETWQKLLPYLKGYVEYLLQAGDTYWQLARKYGTTIAAIRRANPSVNPLYLAPGTTLKIPLPFSLVPTDVPYSSLLTEWILDGLITRYPFLELETVGHSVMGRPLSCLRIGNGKKETFYNASFHANEWITTPLLLNFAEQYASAYTQNESIGGLSARQLFTTCSLYLIPLVNPDGVDLVTGALTEEHYLTQAQAIAADYPMIPFPDGWKANIDGIDLNLQFPAGWENARRIKYAQGYTSPAPRDFVGYEPLSAPESKALYDFTLRHDFSLILAFHTQGEVIYWKYLDYDPKGAYELGRYFSQVSGYLLEETPETSGYAGYKDWFIMHYNRPGYTIEVGLGINPLPLSQFPKIYRDILGILTGAMAFSS